MSTPLEREARETYARFVALRDQIDTGNASWSALADFFTDANDFLANPNRTVSPVTLRRFQVRYMNIPGLEKPVQPLDVWYSSAYVQDEFRPLSNLTITGGLRVDIAAWGETAYPNPNVDALTFRDPSGSPVQFSTGALPKASPLWSPRSPS